ncbi:MAG TPA: acetate/propionate family kinase [Bryobacteraceae bacterium]|jgi:acetate kinase
MNILTLNAGSNSLKFEIVAAKPGGGFGESLLAGAYDNIGKEHSVFSLLENKKAVHTEATEIRDYGHAAELLFDWIEHGNAANRRIRNLGDMECVAHRVVHGGDSFDGPARITEEAIHRIEALEEIAPLHNRSALEVIRAAQAKVRSDLPMVALFDTVFHRSIPDEAAFYPIPIDLARRHKIRRYGFHGISHRYLMLRHCQIANRPIQEANLVTLHLEGGSSAAAIRRGQSIDTSMGFTPLEGLMMGTRSGDVDPALVLYLMRKENMDAKSVEAFLNKKCGLLAVSKVSADTRELEKRLSDKSVELAVNMFCYRVRKYVGAYLAALGGAEAVVVGGGIGENTPFMRERMFREFDWCGAILDSEQNRTLVDREGKITTPKSSLPIWVIPTQEGLMMAKEAADWMAQDG